MADAEMTQRIHHRALQSRRRADSARLADAFGAQRVIGRRGLQRHERERWQLRSRDEAVVGEVGSHGVAVFVIHELFGESLADALGDAAVTLAFHDVGVQDRAGVVAGYDLGHGYLACLGVYLGHHNMRSEGVAAVGVVAAFVL